MRNFRYVPIFDMQLNLNDAFQKETKEEAEEAKKGSGSSGAKGAMEEFPNIMESGLTQEALERLGYRFKEESKAAQSTKKRESGLEEFPLSVGYRSGRNSLVASAAHEADSFSTTTDDDTPRPIIKKTTVEGFTTTTPVARRHQLAYDTSNIEITPGLFVRKQPTSNGRGGKRGTDPIRRGKTEDESPQMPELQTANLKELLLLENGNKKEATPNKSAAVAEDADDDVLPPTPILKTMNLRDVLQPKKKAPAACQGVAPGLKMSMPPPPPFPAARATGMENRDPVADDSDARLTPDTPDFKDRFMRELARSGMKKPEAAVMSPIAGSGVDDVDVTPEPPALSSISKAIINRETYL